MIYGELELVYHDKELVVVNKPSGLLSVPGRGPDKQDCVVRRLQNRFPAMIEQPAVHRLDMATSGLMVLAMTRTSHRHISEQFARQQVEKRYIALLEGVPPTQQGFIALKFRLDPNNRPHQIHDPVQGKHGETSWRLLTIENGRARIELTPHTGRTHQLRLHTSHVLGLGIAIVGDALYGKGQEGEQLFLHACYLSFIHPLNQHRLEFQTEPPF